MELQINGLTKYYGKKAALQDVSLCLSAGIHGILGPNGAGKSTLMKVITGELSPSKGSVVYQGQTADARKKEYRKALGYVPQSQAMYPDFTVIEFLRYISLLKELPEEAAEAQIARFLEKAELADIQNAKIRTLSGGMKQRLLIAQGMLGHPSVLLLDEPTAGLDPKQRYQICRWIEEEMEGSIVLISTHLVDDLRWIAKDCMILKQGRILGLMTQDEWLERVREESKEPAENMDDVYLHYFRES